MQNFTLNCPALRKIAGTLVGLLIMFLQQDLVAQTTLGTITAATSSGCKVTFDVCSDDTIRLRPTDMVNYTNFKWYSTAVMPANEIDAAAVAAGNFNVLPSSVVPGSVVQVQPVPLMAVTVRPDGGASVTDTDWPTFLSPVPELVTVTV